MVDEHTLKLMKNSQGQYLGAHTSSAFEKDPKHLAFTLSRYKFVAKMFEGKDSVLEVGCGDGFGSTIVAQAVKSLTGIDYQEYSIKNQAENKWLQEKTDLVVHDILENPYPKKFNAIYSLDVIEHIEPKLEHLFLENIVQSSKENGSLIIGCPNKTAQAFASAGSQIGHINLHTHESLRNTLSKFYQNVFLFGMNDEVLHTGFSAMCHYIMALAVQPKLKL
jgi:2-polyprenyl-3-methyl-5-hydroxy-6-metoxy-1,4-benzoquinol methylase